MKQPVFFGPTLSNWTPRNQPSRAPIAGRWARLEPLDAERHGAVLWTALRGADAAWAYMSHGPFADDVSFLDWLRARERLSDPLFFAIVDLVSGSALGLLALMAIRPEAGAIEIGHILFSSALQRTRVATDAIHLVARLAFDGLGYRRLEWKCDELNAASRRAALRFGFQFEGVFRQHMVVKGRNRDTAWYALLDGDWPAARGAFERWLSPDNFDSEGAQRSKLRE
jgi:RimJ/RimL family protein N-acetyltransferase